MRPIALLVPMMEQAEETTGTKSQMTLADAGYFAASHLAECDRRGQKVVVSEARQRFLEDPYHKDRFTYDEHSDSFRCPQGRTLAFVRIQHANGVPLRLYRAEGGRQRVSDAWRSLTPTSPAATSTVTSPAVTPFNTCILACSLVVNVSPSID